MYGFDSRPIGRLFLLLSLLVTARLWGQAPPLTTVQDTVYEADGTPAQGTLLISWPAFTTASGQAVAGGSTSATLGAGGALSVALVSNANATPVNTVYTVVYQTDVVKTEYWIVPTTSPATLAQVRTTLGTSNASSQLVTQQYVNTAVATKANDSAVVHNSGNETISGVKQFSSSPSVPTPVQSGDAVNKQYVDNSVQNNGSGSYLSTSGGTMTGTLVLAGDPTSANQAADKHYADILAAVKADLIAGLVPPSELGSGTPGASTCLLGNQTWGACGSGGGSSSYINSILIANPNFNAFAPPAQSGFLNCSFQNAGSNVSLECPYGASSSAFALGSQTVLNNQSNTYSAGVQDFSVASLKLPNGAGYSPAASGEIGYDTTANMPVVNVNGTTQQLALTTSNISGQASTALALAATPAQCNGSFATGIQANGNANCSVADVLELAETSQPAGIPNYGIFWFDSATHTPRIIEEVELGGVLVIEHGDVMITAPSSAVLGGLYPASVSIAGCLAGFSITPSGSQSNIQALVNGALTGTAITTVAGHHYILTTRIYSQEIYRRQQIFHSSQHPAGSGIGGAEVAADVRIVLEVHDIDPSNPATEVAAATILYDNLISAAPDFCTYAPVNAATLNCTIAFTRLIQASDAEVRSALPGLSYVTQTVGPLSEGAECNVTSSGELEFYTPYVPAANQQIEVHYRGHGRALARVTNPASIAAQTRGVDNGCHGAVRRPKQPLARTTADCENAALALFDDSTNPSWTGQYECWSDFLPGGASDIFPGDGLSLNVPSRGASLQAAVREVQFSVNDFEGEHCRYKIIFANDSAEPLAFEFDDTKLASLPWISALTNVQIGATYIADLTNAAITQVNSTTLNVDAGTAPPSGGGIEVRWSDSGWGPGNDRNLVGRFSSQTFTVPRLAQVQDCYLRQYDASALPKYSRYTTALHVDYPMDYPQ